MECSSYGYNDSVNGLRRIKNDVNHELWPSQSPHLNWNFFEMMSAGICCRIVFVPPVGSETWKSNANGF